MKKGIFTLAIFSILSLSLFAQDDRKMENDPTAKVLLDEVSAQFKSYKSMLTNFKMVIESPEDDLKEASAGKVWLKDDKYRIETEEFIIVCDNVKRWIYLKSDNELQINMYEPDGESIESPTELFTIYEKGFYYRMAGTATVNGKEVKQIKLIPKDLENSTYKQVMVFVDEKSKTIVKAVITTADGVFYTWELTDMKTNSTLPEGTFSFDKTKYPDIVVDDMTE